MSRLGVEGVGVVMLSFFPSGYLISRLLKLDVVGMILGLGGVEDDTEDEVVAERGLEDDTVA